MKQSRLDSLMEKLPEDNEFDLLLDDMQRELIDTQSAIAFDDEDEEDEEEFYDDEDGDYTPGC